MNEETIEIKIKVVEESVQVSDLTEREKQIHSHGFELGFKKGIRLWPGIVAAFGMIILMFAILAQCGH